MLELLGPIGKIGQGIYNAFQQNKQAKFQKQMAYHGLEIKAKQAERMGVSKLVALGAPTHTPAPVGVGIDGIGDASQDIGRALNAYNAAPAKADSMSKELATIHMESAKVDLDLKKLELLSRSRLLTAPGTPPGISVSDKDTTPAFPPEAEGVKLKKEIAPASPMAPHRSFGVSPEVDMYRSTGGYTPQIPQALAESLESSPVMSMQWYLRNGLLPSIMDSYRTEPYKLPYGQSWVFNPVTGEYQIANVPKDRWEHLMKGLRR